MSSNISKCLGNVWNVCQSPKCPFQWTSQFQRTFVWNEWPTKRLITHRVISDKIQFCQFRQTTHSEIRKRRFVLCVRTCHHESKDVSAQTVNVCGHPQLSVEILKCRWMSLNVADIKFKPWFNCFLPESAIEATHGFSFEQIWISINVRKPLRLSVNVRALFAKRPHQSGNILNVHRHVSKVCVCWRGLNDHGLAKLAKFDFVRNDPASQTKNELGRTFAPKIFRQWHITMLLCAVQYSNKTHVSFIGIIDSACKRQQWKSMHVTKNKTTHSFAWTLAIAIIAQYAPVLASTS